MREAQVNPAIRRVTGSALPEILPDHSPLTRIRQRRGEDMFRRALVRVVPQCQAAGLVSAETVHIGASLIRANVRVDALVLRPFVSGQCPDLTRVTSGKTERAGHAPTGSSGLHHALTAKAGGQAAEAAFDPVRGIF